MRCWDLLKIRRVRSGKDVNRELGPHFVGHHFSARLGPRDANNLLFLCTEVLLKWLCYASSTGLRRQFSHKVNDGQVTSMNNFIAFFIHYMIYPYIQITSYILAKSLDSTILGCEQ